MTHLEHAGWDTEYDQDEATGRQAPVTTQLYLPEIFPHTNERLRLSDHLGKELLTCTAIPDRGTTLVFDDRGLTAGAEYYERFKARWLTLIDILQLTTDKRGLILWTHYSNAEIANIAATNDEFRSLMKANGDTLCIENPYKNENLRLFPKGKSFNLRNLKITESFKISVFDTTHLYAKTTLALLGMSINFPKLEHPDWDKVSASEWLKSDEKAFLEYAAFDAAIPCEAAIQLYDGVKQTIHDLADMGLIPHIGDKTVQRVLNKQWMTASSMSENIAKLCFIQQGVWKDWDEAAEDLVQNLPENALTKVKGGLNKYFTSDKPQHFDNVAAYDIKSAYASALKQIQYPLWKPEHFATNESISFHDLATKLDGYQGAYLNIEYALPEGANEWERALVFQNPRNYAGFTGRVTGKYQWFTHFEIQAQASITPSVIVKVVQGIGWKKKKGGKVADLAPMMNALLDLRQKYKSAGNESMQTTIKLIGNGTWGKLSQQTNALTPELMHDSILQEAKIHRSTHSDTIYSLITNPVLANWVTGFTRSVVAVTAYKNQAIMAVTDSVLIPGKWIESSNIKVPYGHLQNALNSTTWECEHKNVSAVIFRERDYYYYKCKTKDPERVKAEIINAAITNKSLKKMDVVKAAKLGKPSVKGEGAEKSRKQFAKDSEKRFIGEPIKFTHKKLISAKGMLSEGKILNQPFDVERSIGCHNLRHMCDTNEEFERRVMLKEKCRIKGWADTWHYEKHHPEAVKELRKRCTHNPQHKKSLPQDIQHLIMCAIDSGAASIRQIAEIIGIGKSTIHRWAKDFKSSGEAVQTTIRGGIDTLDYAYPVKALQRWMASTSAG